MHSQGDVNGRHLACSPNADMKPCVISGNTPATTKLPVPSTNTGRGFCGLALSLPDKKCSDSLQKCGPKPTELVCSGPRIPTFGEVTLVLSECYP